MLTIYTRHSQKCPHKNDIAWRRCRCPKWIQGTPSKDHEFLRTSAQTRTWEQAEEKARKLEEAPRHGAQADCGRYNKLLLPKQALAEIQKIVSEARQEHYFMTVPWGDDGYRVLPAAAYMDHRGEDANPIEPFRRAVETWSRQFLTVVDQAKTQLGGLFHEEDYPACNELAAKVPKICLCIYVGKI